MHIYKILHENEWIAAQKEGVFKGSTLDLKDGYIHCSTAEQVDGTVKSFFTNAKDLIKLTIDVQKLGTDLKWEASPRSGKMYPHIYSFLELTSISNAEKYSPN